MLLAGKEAKGRDIALYEHLKATDPFRAEGWIGRHIICGARLTCGHFPRTPPDLC